MSTENARLTGLLSILVADACQTIETLFDRAAQGQPAGSMLVLAKNAGVVGIDCIGGLRREQGALLVCFRRSRRGVAAPSVAVADLLRIVDQLEGRTYTFEVPQSVK